MIDEELYQFATEELNSERRSTELWNRACALARDDHDEARFLYTNLRVEELLEQKANGEPMPEMPLSVKGAATDAFDADAAPNAADVSLGTAVLSEPELAGEIGETGDAFVASSSRAFSDESSADLSEDLMLELQASNAANASDDDIPLPDSATVALADDTDEGAVTFDSSAFNDELSQASTAAASAPNTTPLDSATTPPNTDLDLDIAALAAQASERVLGKTARPDHSIPDISTDVADTPMETSSLNLDASDFSAAETGAFEPVDDSVPEAPTLNDTELAFLDASIDEGRDNIIDQQREVLHQKDALTEDLERQADTWLPEGVSAESTADDAALIAEATLADTADFNALNTSSANIDSVAQTVDTANFEEPVTPMPTDANTFSADAIDQLRGHNVGDNLDTIVQNSNLGTGGELIDDSAIDALQGVGGGALTGLAGGGVAIASASGFAQNQGSQLSQDYSTSGAGAIGDTSANSPSLDQAELLSGKGGKYRVFSRGPNDTRAVKSGLSWAALFFTLPWLLVKRMPLTAIVYALLWLVLAAGLIVTGLHWLDAPKEAQSSLAMWPLAFGVLTVIGIIILPLFMANRWHANSLSNRGYEEIASVRAKSPSRAVDRIMQMAS